MEPIFIAVAVSIALYMAAVMLIPKSILEGNSAFTRSAMSKIEPQEKMARKGNLVGVRDQISTTNPLIRSLMFLPGIKYAQPLFVRSGMIAALDKFALGLMLLFLVLTLLLSPRGIVAPVLAFFLTWAAGWLYLHRKVKQRKRAFIEQFPDALDAIVRGVRSGHSLNTAIGMVADNMPAPVGVEFRRVVDETTFGFTLSAALTRMAERLQEPDVNFFVVVLNVQQETGGNLSESLSNLSTLIRKRRQVRLRIRALAAEGKATMWILAALPVVMTGALLYMAPSHLNPLFETTNGNILLACVIGAMLAGVFIIRQIVNMDI